MDKRLDNIHAQQSVAGAQFVQQPPPFIEPSINVGPAVDVFQLFRPSFLTSAQVSSKVFVGNISNSQQQQIGSNTPLQQLQPILNQQMSKKQLHKEDSAQHNSVLPIPHQQRHSPQHQQFQHQHQHISPNLIPKIVPSRQTSSPSPQLAPQALGHAQFQAPVARPVPSKTFFQPHSVINNNNNSPQHVNSPVGNSLVNTYKPQKNHVVNKGDDSGAVYAPNSSNASSSSIQQQELAVGSLDSSASVQKQRKTGSKKKRMQKRGGPWTDDEHRRFEQGLRECGHNWSRIAKEYVKTRVRTQVASHAQKYFQKQKKIQQEEEDDEFNGVEDEEETLPDEDSPANVPPMQRKQKRTVSSGSLSQQDEDDEDDENIPTKEDENDDDYQAQQQ